MLRQNLSFMSSENSKLENSKPDASELLDGIGESLRRFGGPKALLQKVLDTIPQAVFWKDSDLNYLGCNKLFAEHAGIASPADIIGLCDFDMPWDQKEAEFYRSCDQRVIDSGQAEIGIIESQINADGELTWLDTNKVPLHNDAGQVIGILGTYHDITRLKRAEEELLRQNEELEQRVDERTRELKYVANHDGLTGLSNRSHFVQQLNGVLNSEEQDDITLMFIDLDNFKPVNDNDGHDAGDQLLVQVSQILRSMLGPRDFAGRFGGDEFLVLMRGMANESDAAGVCQELLRRLNCQVAINEKQLMVAASIGVVFCDLKMYEASDDLLGDADVAMYAAKAQGKNGYCFFREPMRHQVGVEANIRTHLVAGLNDRQFVLHYQPIIDMAEGRIHSFEALVRWQHPERGLVPPLEFIPFAESTGLIVQIGQQIIEASSCQLADWRTEFGVAVNELRMNINLSPRQLLEARFVESLRETVERYNIDPSLVCLEITESLLLTEQDNAIRTLREVRELGFRLYLDDFGTGYSSLSYLDELPVDALKIDRAFVNKFDTDNCDNAVVRMILALAETMNVGVVAEGVENEKQIEILDSMNCHLLQGYHFSRPMPADVATRYISEHLEQGSFRIDHSAASSRSGSNHG